MTSLIKYNGKNILYFNFDVKIFPGINEVEDAVLDGILAHHCFASRFEKGDLVLVEDGRKGKRKKEKSEEETLKLIGEIYDSELLKKIIKTDKRESVIAAARERIFYLSGKAEEKIPEVGEHGHFE